MGKIKSVFKIFKRFRRKKGKSKTKRKVSGKHSQNAKQELVVNVDMAQEAREPRLHTPRYLSQKIMDEPYSFEMDHKQWSKQSRTIDSLAVDDDESMCSAFSPSTEQSKSLQISYHETNQHQKAYRSLDIDKVHISKLHISKLDMDQTSERKAFSTPSCSEQIKRFVQKADILPNPQNSTSIDVDVAEYNEYNLSVDTESQESQSMKRSAMPILRSSMDDWIERADRLNDEIMERNGNGMLPESSMDMINDLVDTVTEEIHNDMHLRAQSDRVQLLTDSQQNSELQMMLNEHIAAYPHVVPKCEELPNPPNSKASTVANTVSISVSEEENNVNSEDEALQTIIKYTESSLASAVKENAIQNAQNANNQKARMSVKSAHSLHSVTSAQSGMDMNQDDIITPRINKLESMVEKVVVTNVTLMQNFAKFMEEYHIQSGETAQMTSPGNQSLKNCQTTKQQEKLENVQRRRRSKSLRFGDIESSESREQDQKQKTRERVGSCDFQRRKQKRYRTDRGPKLSSLDRGRKRRAFNRKTKKRFERELKEEIRCMKQLEEMERQIMIQRAQMHMYRARPIKKFKHTEIVLPRRKLKVKKVAIYDRAIKAKREKEDYLNEFRRLRDMQMGIPYPQQPEPEEYASECDMGMRFNGCESRLRVMQSLRLRQ